MAGRETMVNSYDAGYQPYIHDPKRGKWEGRWDFFFAHLPNVYGLRSFLVFATFMEYGGPVSGYVMIPLLFSTFLYIIPVFFIQSFLGQFSGTGFISVFRISPLFKGVGYVILALNIMSSIYGSSIAAIPFLLFLKSFQLSASWMHCGNSWNTENCTTLFNESSPYMYDDITYINVTGSMDPQYEYFAREVLKMTSGLGKLGISWTAILGQFVIWALIWCVVFRGIKIFTKFLRYSALICSILIAVIFIRICFLPEIGNDMERLFGVKKLSRIASPHSWIIGPLVAMTILGRGWGTTLTMASFQQFKADTERYSFVITLMLTVLSGFIGYMVMIINGFITRRSLHLLYYNDHSLHEDIFVAIPYFCGHLEAAPVWSIIFFLMFFLAELSLIAIQTFATVTALTDEYVVLRDRKLELSAGLCSISFLLSIPFGTEHLDAMLKRLINTINVNQMFICFIEVMIVVWIYGRTRFIRDVRFMLIRNIGVWKFYMIRFVTPIFILFTFLVYLGSSVVRLRYVSVPTQILVVIFKFTPWLFIPAYIVFKLVTSFGTLRERFRKCTQPTDWYPADPADKLRYELALGASDTTQQLLEMNDNTVL